MAALWEAGGFTVTLGGIRGEAYAVRRGTTRGVVRAPETGMPDRPRGQSMVC